MKRMTMFRQAAAAVFVFVALGSGSAMAQAGSVRIQSGFDLAFDCHRPFNVKNHPIRARFKAVLNSDKSASADLALSGIFTTNTVHFDVRLGRSSQSAPQGTAQLRVVAANRLRAIWDLPNNQLTLDVVTSGNTCTSLLAIKLKPGKTEYALYGGNRYYYCTNFRLLRSSCNVE